jgi:cell division transport system permease protein
VANSKGTSYFYAIFGITLVLFVVGMATFFVYEAKRVSADFKETLMVEAILKDDVPLSKVSSLQTHMQGKRYIKNVKFISKQDAVDFLQKNGDVEKNFTDILGYNPLYASFFLNLTEAYANKDSFKVVKSDLEKTTEIKQVNIQSALLDSLDRNVKTATLIVLIIASALLIFAVSLIFNTIRLVMFSKRFAIKTQQLFGATRWFIIKPFLGRSLVNGLVSGIIANGLIAGVVFYLDYALPELGLHSDLVTFALLSGAVVLFGILISFFSTWIAVSRYLRLKLEDLY